MWKAVQIHLVTSDGASLTDVEATQIKEACQFFEKQPNDWRLLMRWLSTPDRDVVFPEELGSSRGRPIHRGFYYLLQTPLPSQSKPGCGCPMAENRLWNARYQSLQRAWREKFQLAVTERRQQRFDPFPSDVRGGNNVKLLFMYDVDKPPKSSDEKEQHLLAPPAHTVRMELQQLFFYHWVFASGLADSIRATPDAFQVSCNA